MNSELVSIAIKTWEKSVDVQQHFNEICMKIRNFYITLITALLAFTGVLIAKVSDPFFHMFGLNIHISVPLFISIWFASYLFYFIDRHWYHRLLIGAVKNALEIEKQFADNIPGIGLSSKIGESSPLDISECSLRNYFLFILGLLFGADKRIWTERRIHSDAKIAIFYKSVAYLFLIISVIIITFNSFI